MPGFGWAYINLDSLTDVGGATGSVLFKADDNNITGTAFLAYATGTNRVGIGLDFPTTLPEFQLDISASATQDTAVRILGDLQITGSAYISGNLEVESLHAHTVISSSNLIVRDPIMGLGFGDDANETGSAGDRGFIFGLNGNLNQAILWDQSVGSFIMGKAAAQGPDRTEYTIADSDLSILKVGALSASSNISASVNISASGFYGDGANLSNVGAVSAVANGDDNRVATFSSADALNGEANLTFDGSTLTVGNDISVAGKVIHTGDTDTNIKFDTDKIEFIAGSETLLTVKEDTQDVVTVGDGGDVDFQVRTSGDNNTLFVQGSSDNVGVKTDTPSHTLSVIGDISASVHISASAVIANAISSSAYFGLGTDTDTRILFTDDDINFTAGGVNFLDLTEDDSQDEVTFNEEGVDIDFRVETADESHMLFIEGSSNRMSIGDNTGSPGATLEIKNHATAGATGVPLLQLNNNDTDQQCVDINAGNIDANVVNITANDVTTARVLAIGADGLTTGNALYVDDNSSNTGTRNTALIIQNNAAAINAQALAIQSDGGKTGVKIDKNYSDTAETSVVGLDIDWDKTGASTTNNTMFGIQLDMDNTTATNGNNTMTGLQVTPTLTHAADAGAPKVKGAVITATGGTNGTSTATGMELTSTGADTNEGLIINCADGGTDLKIVSSADTGDYFQIQTTTHGATTFTTVDDNAAAANLTFTVDGDITLDPAGGDVTIDGNITGSAALRINGDITGSHTLFVDSTNRFVGIGRSSPYPKSQLYISSSQPSDVLQSMFRIEHPGTVDYPASDPCFIVTGSMPDDFFEARIGINKGSPAGALHVKSKGGDSLVVHEDKVAIGHSSATSKLQIRANTNDLFRVSRVDPGDDNIIHQPFFVSGNVGMEKFGSDLSTAIFINSGSAHIGNGLFMGGGQMVEYLDTTDEDSQDVALSAAEFKKGIVVHTSTTGEGTVTMDTAANLISTLGLTADNMTAHCYYINDGNQNVLVSGASSGVTYADTGCKIKENCAATILVRRTGSSAVTVYVIGGS